MGCHTEHKHGKGRLRLLKTKHLRQATRLPDFRKGMLLLHELRHRDVHSGGSLVFGILCIIGGCKGNWKFVHIYTMWQVFCLIWSIIALIVNIIMYATAGTYCYGGTCVNLVSGFAWFWMIAMSLCFWALSVGAILVTHTFAKHLFGGGSGDVAAGGDSAVTAKV